MNSTTQRKQALRAARALVLVARSEGGKELDGIWEYLRDELDQVSVVPVPTLTVDEMMVARGDVRDGEYEARMVLGGAA